MPLINLGVSNVFFHDQNERGAGLLDGSRGLKAPFDHLIPLVEFSMSTPLNRGVDELTTGTINPGVIWSGQYYQVGVEAIIPVNAHTGHNVGVIAQVHFYLDDLLPKIFSKPLFER